MLSVSFNRKRCLQCQPSGVADKDSPREQAVPKSRWLPQVCWPAALGTCSGLRDLGSSWLWILFHWGWTLQTMTWKLSIFTVEKFLPGLSYGISEFKLHHQTITSIFKPLFNPGLIEHSLILRAVVLYIGHCDAYIHLPPGRQNLLKITTNLCNKSSPNIFTPLFQLRAVINYTQQGKRQPP